MVTDQAHLELPRRTQYAATLMSWHYDGKAWRLLRTGRDARNCCAPRALMRHTRSVCMPLRAGQGYACALNLNGELQGGRVRALRRARVVSLIMSIACTELVNHVAAVPHLTAQGWWLRTTSQNVEKTGASDQLS